MRKFYALFVARNKEFLRDRGTLAWNLLFPFLVIAAVGLVFSGEGRDLYKVGLVQHAENGASAPQDFLDMRYVQFVPVQDKERALEQVRRHRLDMVLEEASPARYWINQSNPKGYILERVLQGSGASNGGFARQTLEGREIRYVDWLLPGVLAMNMMFSCLWGVGYVIVRYRKGGILRRLKAAPISAHQFLAAQVASRLVLVMVVTAVVFIGAWLVLDIYVVGNVLALGVVFTLGAMCLVALGLAMASRTRSQELAGGLMNLITWPMMFLSGVWFSLEGSPDWLIAAAQLLPLTHLIDAARGIMVDGATLLDVAPQLGAMTGMTVAFLVLGSALFRWE